MTAEYPETINGVVVSLTDQKRYRLIKQHGACRDYPTGLFFTDRGTAAAVKRICEICQVKGMCLDLAITYREIGWWGGTSQRERARILRDRQVVA